MRLLFLLATASLAGVAPAAELHEVYFQGLLTPNNITPTFDTGYLLVHDHPKIDVYAPDGSPLHAVAPVLAGAEFVQVINAAADADGTVAGAVEYAKSKRRSGGVAVFDPAGKQTQFFDTGQYLPAQVAFGDDHSIWTLGWQGGSASGEEYFLLRHYSQSGEELGAFLKRSSFDAAPDPVGPDVGGIQLRANGGKIGVLLYVSSVLHPGEQQRKVLWVELDSKGKELGRWDLDVYGLNFAFSRSGTLYAQRDGGISIFDRSARAWRKVAGAPGGTMLGIDGDSLVVWVRGTNTLRWVPTAGY